MKRISLLTLVVTVCLFCVPIAMAADTIPVGVPIPMTGWAAGMFVADAIAPFVKKCGIEGKIKNKKIESYRASSPPSIIIGAW